MRSTYARNLIVFFYIRIHFNREKNTQVTQIQQRITPISCYLYFLIVTKMTTFFQHAVDINKIFDMIRKYTKNKNNLDFRKLKGRDKNFVEYKFNNKIEIQKKKIITFYLPNMYGFKQIIVQ